MDTNNLRYFAAVAKYGSITQAAKAAYISQPQLSHIIHQMEKEMGITLFRRTSHGTKLTTDGQRILLHCQVILREMDRLQHMVNAHKIEKSCLNVSMTRFSHTAECYNEICRRYQDIDSFTGRLCEGAPLDVIRDVKEVRSNIGVIHTSAKDAGHLKQDFADQGLTYSPLAVFRPYVCLSSEHELVRTIGRHGIDIRELVDYGFVRYIGQYEDFIYHLTTESGPIDLNHARKIVYVNDRQEQMRLLSRTNFFTVGIMEFKDQDSLYDVISVPLLGCEERFSFGLIKKKDTVLSQMEKDFADLLAQRFKKMQMSDSE
jgi:molybdate transport repressor ModE-like protein